ncbi:MAG: diguanylate cyclase [Candidatus Nanopelagicales bacterium]
MSFKIAVAAVAYLAAAVISIYVSREPGSIAAVWFANALGIVCLVGIGTHRWAALSALLAANLLANLLCGNSIAASATFLPGNGLEMALGAWLLQSAYRGSVEDPVKLSGALLRGSVIPVLAASVPGALAVHSIVASGSLAATWLIWTEGSLVGSMSILPLGLAWLQRGPRSLGREISDPVSLGLILISLAMAAYASSNLPYPFVYMLFPLMVTALRTTFSATSLAVLLVSVTISLSVAYGYLTAPASGSDLAPVWLYLPMLMTLVPPTFVAAIVESRERAREELVQVNNRLDLLAHHDSLTGLENRLSMDSLLESLDELDSGMPAVAVVDVDRFKQINDTYGHAAGDQVLRVIGQRLMGAVRAEDRVFRTGGDEFLVVIAAPSENQGEFAQRIHQSISEPIQIDAGSLPISVSVGMALPQDARSIRGLVAAADDSLYVAKNAGRNQVVVGAVPGGPAVESRTYQSPTVPSQGVPRTRL